MCCLSDGLVSEAETYSKTKMLCSYEMAFGQEGIMIFCTN